MDRRPSMPTESMPRPIVEYRSVTLGYSRGTDILSRIDLCLEPGMFYFLTGASGAGKSTLLRSMSLTLPCVRGTMRIFGHAVTRTGDTANRDNRALLRQRIGIVFQNYRLIDELTVFENTALPLRIANHDNIAARVRELLDWVGLAGYADRLPPTLSGGQQQRVAIARAVIAKPDLLLADEPTGSVDHETGRRLLYLFDALNKGGTTIVFATHDPSLLRRQNPLIRLHNGALTLYPPGHPHPVIGGL